MSQKELEDRLTGWLSTLCHEYRIRPTRLLWWHETGYCPEPYDTICLDSIWLVLWDALPEERLYTWRACQFEVTKAFAHRYFTLVGRRAGLRDMIRLAETVTGVRQREVEELKEWLFSKYVVEVLKKPALAKLAVKPP